MDGLKLHIGAGCCYLLDGYINVDVWGSGAALAKDCPAGVDKWGTTSDNYYGKVQHIDAAYLGKSSADHESIVCDCYGSWCNLPFPDESAAEICSIQTFEHLSKTESHWAMAEARRVLKVGANLRLGVPDHEATLKEYARLKCEAKHFHGAERIKLQTDASFMLRHLLGSRKNDWAYHMGSWTKPKLVQFAKKYGFRLVEELPNINFYPAIHLLFEKLPTCDFPELDEPIHAWKAAWEYVDLPKREPGQTFIEVGPGTAPWPEANLYCDIVDRPNLPPMSFCRGDVQELPYADKAADFIYVAHCLEHVEDPEKAASELSRVAKAGCVVCPSPLKEGLYAFHEQDHKWNVFKSGDVLYFKRIPSGLYESLYDADVSAQMHRLWRYGDRRLEGFANKAKRWMHTAEPLLDVIHFWKDSLKIVVLE